METTEEPRPATEMNPDQLQSDMDTIKNVLTETDKEREIHRILIAAGNFICGVIFLIATPFLGMVVGVVGVATPDAQPAEPSPTLIVGSVMTALSMLLVVLSLPFLLAGWGVLKRKGWGAVMAVIAGFLNLANFPLGTALGIYTFWAVIRGKLQPS